jgi:hypothetical protein
VSARSRIMPLSSLKVLWRIDSYPSFNVNEKLFLNPLRPGLS